MKKITYVVSAMASFLIYSNAWSGIPGTYHCKPPQTDKHGKGNIVVHKSGEKIFFCNEFCRG